MANGKIKFTAGRAADFQCEPGKSQSFLWDADINGLGLRATSNGAKTYIFQSRLNGVSLRVTIGAYPAWSIEQARAKAAELRVTVDNGRDPRQVRADAETAQRAKADAVETEAEERRVQEKRASMNLSTAWAEYTKARAPKWGDWHRLDHESVIKAGGEKKKRGKGLTEPGALAPLCHVKLVDLSGKCIGEWLTAEAQVRPTRAALAFRLLSVFANWCESQSEYSGLIPVGACKAAQVRDALPKSNAKEGDCLQRGQLESWFKSVRELSNPVHSAYFQTLLLTGARRRELSALKWADIDFQWSSLTIRDKVDGERTIPLTTYVAQLLAALPRRNEWVFSSVKFINGKPSVVLNKSGQMTDPTAAHKKALKNAALPDLTLHGLRRSFGSLAEWVEIPTGVVAQIMGHKPSAIAEKHYRRRPLDLLAKWHTKLEAWILEQADIEFIPVGPGLRVITAA